MRVLTVIMQGYAMSNLQKNSNVNYRTQFRIMLLLGFGLGMLEGFLIWGISR